MHDLKLNDAGGSLITNVHKIFYWEAKVWDNTAPMKNNFDLFDSANFAPF